MHEKICHATHPDMMTQAGHEQLRERYLISNLFIAGRIKHDLAGAAVFLASRASNYVHGITLPVDGGWPAR